MFARMTHSRRGDSPSGVLRVASILFGLTLALLTLSATTVTAAEPIKSASEYDYPPFAVTNKDGQADGFSVELLREALRTVGRDVQFKVGPWHELKQELVDGKIQVLPFVGRNAERQLVYDFTAPYLSMHGTLVVRKGDARIRRLDDLRGKTVVVLKGDNAEEYVREHKLTDKIATAETLETALRQLADGQHDAMLVQKLAGESLIRTLGLDNLETVGPPIDRFQSFCFAVRLGDKELLATLNEGLSLIIANGTVEWLREKWITPTRDEVYASFRHNLAIVLGVLLLGGLPAYLVHRSRLAEANRRAVALSQSEERYRNANAFLEATGSIGKIGGWSLDVETQALKWTEETYRLHELNSGESVSVERGIEFYAPAARPVISAAVQECIEKGHSFDLELPVVTASGKPIWVRAQGQAEQVDGKTVRLIGAFQDITERKRTEEETRRMALVIDAAPSSIIVHDFDGRFLYANQRTFELHGYSREEFMALSLRQVDAPADEKLIAARMQELRECSEAFFEAEHLRKDGTILPLEVSVKITTWAGNEAILSISTDITERTRAEKEKAALEAQLQQVQKMDSVGRLAGGVAHDFNNMLTVILGNVAMAIEQVDTTQPVHTDLLEIHKAASRSADLTRQLLAFARKQVVAPKVLDLNDTVVGIIKMLQRLIGEDISLKWLPDANLWPVKVDPSQIDQILANLCINARDAIAGVGNIAIETGNSAFDEDYCAVHAGFTPGEYVRLAVSDNGHGIDKETLSHIFEPFFTTKGAGEGTGLGLATVYGAVKQNNGFINVYSEPDTGTTFTIYLPRHEGGAEQVSAADAASTPVRGQETILLVEDEPSILKLTTRVLTRQGYAVLAANTPGEAVRLASEHASAIHLLMTDVVMPEMNGRDLAKNLQSRYPGLKLLFMSGYTANIIVHQGVLDQGVQFIQKPFSIDDLAAKVREVLDSE